MRRGVSFLLLFVLGLAPSAHVKSGEGQTGELLMLVVGRVSQAWSRVHGNFGRSVTHSTKMLATFDQHRQVFKLGEALVPSMSYRASGEIRIGCTRPCLPSVRLP